MTISLSDNTPRVSYSVAEGVTQTSFTVNFEFFDDADLNFYVDGTLKTLTTHYTVTGGDGSTGTITTTSGNSVTGISGGSTVVITRDIALARTTDFPSAGAFEVAKLNTELDRFTAIAADINDDTDRSIHLADDDEAVSTQLPVKADRLGKVLGFNATTGAVEAGPTIADVSSLAQITTDISTLADIEDGTDATDAIQTVAGISSNVTTVAGISANVTTVAGITSNIAAVVADESDIGTVATNISSVNTVATNIADVITVANDLNEAVSEVVTVADDLNEAVSEIDTVAGSISNVDTVGTNIANVNTVAGISSNVTTVAGISANVTTVAGISGNVSTVAGISSDVTTVAADGTDIGTVATNITNVNTVAGNNTNITTVAGISANVTSVAGNATNINTVAGDTTAINAVASDATDIGTVATNIANVNTVAGISANVTTVAGDTANIGTIATDLTGSDNIGTVAGSISNVNSVGGSITNVNTVASNISSVNSFADTYRIGATDPTTSLDTGDLFYNTTSSTLKVYTGSAWEQGVTAGSGFLPLTGGGLTGNLTFGDNDKAIFGAGSDLQIYHDGANSYIDDAGTGVVAVRGSTVQIGKYTGELMAQFDSDGAVQLRYDNSKKLETTSTGIDVTGTVTADGVSLGDNQYAYFGASNDLQIYHDGSNSYIDDVGTGNLNIRAENLTLEDTSGNNYLTGAHDGEVRLYYINSQKLAVNNTGIDVTGVITTDGMTTSADINFGDNDKAVFGAGSDLQIYHDGSHSYLWDTGTGNLYIQATSLRLNNGAGTSPYMQCDNGGEVRLYYNGAEKLNTKSDGVDITGELQSDSLDVDGVANISGRITATDGVEIPDNKNLYLGSGSDLVLFHDAVGGGSYINESGTGDLFIQGANIQLRKYGTSEVLAAFNVDGAVQLYHNNSKKIETQSDGINVTGNVQSSSGRYEGASNQDRMVIGGSQIDFYINDSNEFRMESDGDFHADGDVIAYSTTVSDERLKTDIEKIENATDKVTQLNGYTFTYKADGKKSAGVIAQEVEKVLPSAVSEKELPLKTDDGVAYKTVQYDQIIGLLIESIKELKQEINELKGA